MPIEISDCIGIVTQRPGAEVHYIFRVSNGEMSTPLAVPITDQAKNRVGEPARTAEELTPLAKEWLRRHLNLHPNPFSQSAPPIPDVTADIADHWFAHGKLP
jgi:hypothetical protein